MAQVGILMGSESDRSYMDETERLLGELGISYETHVMSAHRTPQKVHEFASNARENGFEVIIAGAGGAAHLPGVIAAWTTLPVIGVPLPGSDLNGWDALLAIVQMPPGVPVATVGVGKFGSRNAAYLAAQIIGVRDKTVREAYAAHRERQAGMRID
ncbi:MAG: 5-(carboxyamino)imidazole ribonucleotide mutase [Chloroflexota bacterium]